MLRSWLIAGLDVFVRRIGTLNHVARSADWNVCATPMLTERCGNAC